MARAVFLGFDNKISGIKLGLDVVRFTAYDFADFAGTRRTRSESLGRFGPGPFAFDDRTTSLSFELGACAEMSTLADEVHLGRRYSKLSAEMSTLGRRDVYTYNKSQVRAPRRVHYNKS